MKKTEINESLKTLSNLQTPVGTAPLRWTLIRLFCSGKIIKYANMNKV
jgi:hypothetical protein